MNKKQIDTILGFGNSHIVPLLNWPKGITKFQAFLTIQPLLTGKQYWYALSDAYTMSDNLFEYYADVKFAFEKNEPDREFLMSKKERTIWKALPESIKIYRCMTRDEQRSGDFSVSWTLDREIAEFFATEYQRNYSTKSQQKVIHELQVRKEQVIAYFHERNESEIIYIHKSIKDQLDKK